MGPGGFVMSGGLPAELEFIVKLEFRLRRNFRWSRVEVTGTLIDAEFGFWFL